MSPLIGLAFAFALLIAFGLLLRLVFKAVEAASSREAASRAVLIAIGVVIVSEIIPYMMSRHYAKEAFEDSPKVVVTSLRSASIDQAIFLVLALDWLKSTTAISPGIIGQSAAPFERPAPRGLVRITRAGPAATGTSCPPEQFVRVRLTRAVTEHNERFVCFTVTPLKADTSEFVEAPMQRDSFWLGPYRVTRELKGVVRKSDGRLFNVVGEVHTTGGIGAMLSYFLALPLSGGWDTRYLTHSVFVADVVDFKQHGNRGRETELMLTGGLL